MIYTTELFTSETAEKLGIKNQPTDPAVWGNLISLMSVIASVRQEIGRPIYITSGYRCPELNNAVGGAKNSAHTHGLAIDVKVLNLDIYLAVSKSFSKFAKRLGYQSIVIFEKPFNGVPSWLHLELSRDKPSRIFTIN